ncbi:MAG: hypothetical protein M0R75_06925 [Dehalococcoidia bacterium]|nr:hypothetical protein [Dehalococcoidia bacterium]
MTSRTYGPVTVRTEYRLHKLTRSESGLHRRLVGTYPSKVAAHNAAKRTAGRYECDEYRVSRHRREGTTETFRGRTPWFVDRLGNLSHEETEALRAQLDAAPPPTAEECEAAMQRFDAPAGAHWSEAW